MRTKAVATKNTHKWSKASSSAFNVCTSSSEYSFIQTTSPKHMYFTYIYTNTCMLNKKLKQCMCVCVFSTFTILFTLYPFSKVLAGNIIMNNSNILTNCRRKIVNTLKLNGSSAAGRNNSERQQWEKIFF